MMRNKNILQIGILIIFLIGFIFAAQVITNSTSTIPEDVNSIVIIDVNNTDALEGANISAVNITLPSGFIFAANSNSTTAGTHTFSNTSNVLSWSNDGLVMNITNQSFVFNVTVATAGTYNLTVWTLNTSNLHSSNVSITVNDTTYPSVSLTTPVSGGNISGNYSLTATITEDTASLVYFNITNSSGGQNGTFTASNPSGTSWNATIDTSKYVEGLYNISVWVNDSNNQINNTVIATSVRIDNTVPAVASFSCTPTSVYTTNPVTCSCSGSDAGSGIASTSYTANPSVTTAGTFTETCTVTDKAGNSASSTTTYTVNTRTSSAASSTTTSFWTGTTYTTTENVFETGFTQAIAVKERIKVKVINENHYIGLKHITDSSATIEIMSDPIEIILNIGEDAKVDVNKDGIYDLLVVLKSIANSEAELIVTKISEEIPEDKEAVETTGEIVTPEEPIPEERKNYLFTSIILISIIIIIVILYNFREKLIGMLKLFEGMKKETI